jgi:hypothetical protein
MADGTRSDHRRRYHALGDLRRLGFEQERLLQRVRSHPDWDTRPLPARRAIEAALQASAHHPGADLVRLEREVRAATARIVLLAKALRALETGTRLPDP